MTTLAVGALSSCLALIIFLHHGTSAEDPGVPGPAAAAPTLHLAPEQYRDIAIAVQLENDPMTSIQELFTQVLHLPMVIDPVLVKSGPPPITLSVYETKSLYVMDLICRLTNTSWRANPDGSIFLSNVPDGKCPVSLIADSRSFPEQHPFTFSRADILPEQFMNEVYRAGGGQYPAGKHFPDQHPISLRLTLREGLSREDWLWNVIEHGASDPRLPFAEGLNRVVTQAWNQVTIQEALAMISADSGLPCRFDPDSGAMPRFSRPAESIACGALLNQLAGTVGALVSQATDGMVLYRARSQRFLDGEGHAADAHGAAYQDHRPSWWHVDALYGPASLVQLPMPVSERIISVDWRERSVADVAQDLRQRLGVAVTILDPEHTASRQVLVQLPQRSVRAILTCLGCSSRCDWTLSSSGIEVKPWAEADAAAQPAAPPAPPQLMPVPAQTGAPMMIPAPTGAAHDPSAPEQPSAPAGTHG